MGCCFQEEKKVHTWGNNNNNINGQENQENKNLYLKQHYNNLN